jgi:hypothetical protein
VEFNRIPPKIAAVSIPLALVFLLSGCSNQNAVDVGSVVPSSSSSSPSPESAPAGADSIKPGLPTPARAPISSRRIAKQQEDDAELLASYQCEDARCRFEAFRASSAEEAKWLESRGFPNADRLGDLEKMPEGALAEEATNGDLAAMAVLGKRQVEGGNRPRGLVNLNDAAVRGSVFADYLLSETLRRENMFDSAAYLRLAYLQGDRKAAAKLYRDFQQFSAAEWLMVDSRAMDLYTSLLAQRVGRGNMVYGPRPNESQ